MCNIFIKYFFAFKWINVYTDFMTDPHNNNHIKTDGPVNLLPTAKHSTYTVQEVC